MWNRQNLKERAKIAFKRNYWKCVIVALILTLVLGGAGGLTFKYTAPQVELPFGNSSHQIADFDFDRPVIGESDFDEYLDFDEYDDFDDFNVDDFVVDNNDDLAIVAAVAAIIFVVFIIVAIIGSLVKILVLNLFEVGGDNFFIKNAKEPAGVDLVLSGFNRYGKNVGAMFLRDLYICLWWLLFIIPGIIKMYSYRLVPYILADTPELSAKEAITLSRELMNGNKWKTFVLDLSFIGWHIVSGFTFGLLEVLYVAPYRMATNAELYHALRYGNSESDAPEFEF